jgi:ferrous-iron efflux pump FieF
VESRRIEEIVAGVPGVESVHDIRSRGDGERLFIEFHLLVKHDGVVEAHRVTEEVEEALARHLGACHVTIHVEPN